MVCLHENFNHFTALLQQSYLFSLWKKNIKKEVDYGKVRPLSFVHLKEAGKSVRGCLRAKVGEPCLSGKLRNLGSQTPVVAVVETALIYISLCKEKLRFPGPCGWRLSFVFCMTVLSTGPVLASSFFIPQQV